MVVIPDRASQRNNFQIIPLSQPRIERAVDCDGFYVLRGDHVWLLGDRRSALAEFGDLERIERRGGGGHPPPRILRPVGKRGRGRAKGSLDLIEAMRSAAEAAQPITGRGIGYKLFTAGLIPLMSRADMQRVYRLLREAREDGTIPWHWITDETREIERSATWSNPEEYARCVAQSCRRDFWDQQPQRVEVWSEKGTVRGVLAPVLDRYAVGFRVMHGFSSATSVHDVAEDDDGRDLTALYVGDYDP